MGVLRNWSRILHQNEIRDSDTFSYREHSLIVNIQAEYPIIRTVLEDVKQRKLASSDYLITRVCDTYHAGVDQFVLRYFSESLSWSIAECTVSITGQPRFRHTESSMHTTRPKCTQGPLAALISIYISTITRCAKGELVRQQCSMGDD